MQMLDWQLREGLSCPGAVRTGSTAPPAGSTLGAAEGWKSGGWLPAAAAHQWSQGKGSRGPSPIGIISWTHEVKLLLVLAAVGELGTHCHLKVENA